jgi:DNA-binding response OmpR family regulator
MSNTDTRAMVCSVCATGPGLGTARILVVEDDPTGFELLDRELAQAGFEALHAGDGEEGLRLMESQHPDLVVLNLGLPGLDGIEVCRQLRWNPESRGVPIIIVTGRTQVPDVILGLETGADDYLPKPFDPRELVARIRALLRRTRQWGEPPSSGLLKQGPIAIDHFRQEARLDGELLLLTPAEMRILRLLASCPGKVFPREELCLPRKGSAASETRRTVDVHVQSLRAKLGRHRKLIQTVQGAGYRFVHK